MAGGPSPYVYLVQEKSGGFPKDGKGRAKYDTFQEAVEAAEKYGPQLIAGITQDHYGLKFTLRAGKLLAQTDIGRRKQFRGYTYFNLKLKASQY